MSFAFNVATTRTLRFSECPANACVQMPPLVAMLLGVFDVREGESQGRRRTTKKREERKAKDAAAAHDQR